MNLSVAVLTLTAMAGGAGAALRHLVDTTVAARLGDHFPWGTTVVNISGSGTLGVLSAFAAGDQLAGATLTVVTAGLVGGYTTFSTTSVETVRLAMGGRHRAAAANAAVHLVACVAAAGFGFGFGRVWL